MSLFRHKHKTLSDRDILRIVAELGKRPDDDYILQHEFDAAVARAVLELQDKLKPQK